MKFLAPSRGKTAPRGGPPSGAECCLCTWCSSAGHAFPLSSLPYLSHVLSVEKFGLVAFAQTFVWYFLTLTEYGFNLTATRAVAQAREAPDSAGFAAKAIQSTTKTTRSSARSWLPTPVDTEGLITMCTVVLSVPQNFDQTSVYRVSHGVGEFVVSAVAHQGLEETHMSPCEIFAAKLLSLAGLVIFVHGEKIICWRPRRNPEACCWPG